MVTRLGRIFKLALVDPGKPAVRLREQWALPYHLLKGLDGPIRMATTGQCHSMKEMGTRVGRIQLDRPARLRDRVLEPSGKQIGATQADKRGNMRGINLACGEKILDGCMPLTQSERSLRKAQVQIAPRARRRRLQNLTVDPHGRIQSTFLLKQFRLEIPEGVLIQP